MYDYIQELREQGLKDDEIKQEIISLTNTPKPIERIVNIEPKPTDWTIPKWFARGKLSLIVGDPGVGKSTLAICLGLIKASGGVVPTDNGFERVESGKVLYVPFEEEPSEVSFIAKLQEISNWGDNFYVWTDTANFSLKQLEKENIDLIIADPMTYIYAEKQRKDITADAYKMLKPYKQLAEKTGCSIVFVWHTRKNKNNIVDSVLSSRIISAMVKRIVFVEKEKDNSRRIFFEKGYPLPSMLFEIKDRIFNWIGVDDKSFDEFNDKIPKKEVVRLIREELQRNPDKSLPFNEIIKLVSPFGISKDYLIKIKSKYLPEVISEPVRRNGKFIGWFWKLPEGKSKVVRLARTLENTTFSPEGQFANNIPQQELTDKKPLKINELEEQEKSDTKKIETVRLVESIDKSTFEPDGKSKTDRLVEMPKKNNNSLKNQDFFRLKVPVVPEELAKKYKIENPELYEDPDFRMFAIGHIISHSRQSKPDKPDDLPTVVINGETYIDVDELFKMEGLTC